MKAVGQLIVAKQTNWAVNAENDAKSDCSETPASCMPAAVVQNGVEERVHFVDEKRTKIIRFRSNRTKTVELNI